VNRWACADQNKRKRRKKKKAVPFPGVFKKKRFLSKIISRTTSASITLEPFLASQLLPSSGYGGVLPHVLHNLTLIGANYAIKA
jgi:hypothetical protein